MNYTVINSVILGPETPSPTPNLMQTASLSSRLDFLDLLRLPPHYMLFFIFKLVCKSARTVQGLSFTIHPQFVHHWDDVASIYRYTHSPSHSFTHSLTHCYYTSKHTPSWIARSSYCVWSCEQPCYEAATPSQYKPYPARDWFCTLERRRIRLQCKSAIRSVCWCSHAPNVP